MKPWPSDDLFYIRVFFVRLFGLICVAEELVVGADEEQVVGVRVVVNGRVIGPAGIPIVFPRLLFVGPTFVA